jgi:hypothetical protein
MPRAAKVLFEPSLHSCGTVANVGYTSIEGYQMTLCISWVRQVGSVTEMIVASDSRLSGGQFWDANPKILMLPRTDSVLPSLWAAVQIGHT